MKILFSKTYCLLTVLLFAIEVFIGTCMHDKYIRPFGGDFLEVILIYCFVKSLFALPVNTAAIATLFFAYVVEVSQYLKLVNHLGLKNAAWANILLGNSFSWMDMLMYTLGILLTVAIERLTQGIWRRKKLPDAQTHNPVNP